MPAAKKTVKNAKNTSHPKLQEGEILAWLQAHPAFLTRHADKLHTALENTSNVTPLHAARASKAEQAHEKLEKNQQRLLKTVHANSSTAADVFALIPQLVACRTLPQLRKFTQTALKKQLQLSATRLILTGKESATTLPAKRIQALFTEGKIVQLRTLYDVEDRKLYGETGKMFKSDCLMHLTDCKGKTLGLLSLASDDAQRFHPGQATELAELIAQTTAAVLEHAGTA